MGKVSVPRAGELATKLGSWLKLALPRYTVHADRFPTAAETDRERDEGVAMVRAWYAKHREDLPAAAARAFP